VTDVKTPSKRRPFTDRPHVALLVETTLESGRDILRGIAHYNAQKGPWSIYHQPRSLFDEPPHWLEGWDGDGIIARVQTEQMADAVRRSGIPCIDVLGAVEHSTIPLVHVNHPLLVQMAADHLIEKGYRRFAYCGLPDQNWSRERATQFQQYITGKGYPVDCHDHISPKLRATFNWERAQNRLSAWLSGLEQPVGILVCSDQIGTDVMDACRRAGIPVPDGAGVIGIDNDEPLCMVCDPPMTSIDAAHQHVGYRAAMELHRMMLGGPSLKQAVEIKPTGVVRRRSTDALILNDANLVRALRFIKDYAVKGIRVDEVAEQAGLSRSVLQRRFKHLLGRTVHEELLRTKLTKAEELLASSALPLAEIAEVAGFNHQEYMGVVFMKRHGITPAAYRLRIRQTTRTESATIPPLRSSL
jgi:LacI family transcriptional regulator